MRRKIAVCAVLAVCLLSVWGAAHGFLEPNERYLFIFVIDGIPKAEFDAMLARGDLPNFKKYIYDRGIHSEHHISVFPPLTFPAMASIFSGSYPSRHRVPTFFWVDRERGFYKNYLSTTLGDYQRDLKQTVCVLFEYFPDERTLCFGLPLGGGATYQRTVMGSFIDPLREPRDLDYISKAVEQRHTIAADVFVRPSEVISLFNPAKETNIISLVNPFSASGMLRYAIDSFSEERSRLRTKKPKVVVYYDWAADHYGHEDGPMSPQVVGSLIRDDTEFGRFVEVYQKAGLYDSTYFALLSDHGQMPLEPHYVPIQPIFTARGFKTAFISHELIAKAGLSGLLQVRSVLFGKGTVVGYNCIIGTAGAGSVNVFLTKNGGTDAASWKGEVYYNDLLQYPVVPGKYINVEDFVNSIDGVNFSLVRENERVPGDIHKTRIMSRRGSSIISARLENTKPVELKYEVIKGADPLSYSENPILAGMMASGFHGDREWLRATAETAYPDALAQIAQIMELDRSGSIIIVPDDGHCFNARVWAKHGGLSAGEMITTFAVAGPGLSPGVVHDSRVIDIVPTLLSLMGKDNPEACFDGIALPDITGERRKAQGEKGAKDEPSNHHSERRQESQSGIQNSKRNHPQTSSRTLR